METCVYKCLTFVDFYIFGLKIVWIRFLGVEKNWIVLLNIQLVKSKILFVKCSFACLKDDARSFLGVVALFGLF